MSRIFCIFSIIYIVYSIRSRNLSANPLFSSWQHKQLQNTVLRLNCFAIACSLAVISYNYFYILSQVIHQKKHYELYFITSQNRDFRPIRYDKL